MDPHDHLRPRWGCANFQMQPDVLWARMQILRKLYGVYLTEVLCALVACQICAWQEVSPALLPPTLDPEMSPC